MMPLQKTLSQLKITETPVASLEGNGAFFVLLPEELLYRNKKEMHRVDLLNLTRIHSDNTKILHFETENGRLFSASLEPFQMSEVKTFFQELGELTNAVKAGKKTPKPAPEPEAEEIVIGELPKDSANHDAAETPKAEEITPQMRQQMHTQISESVASQKKPVWAQTKSSTPAASAKVEAATSAAVASPETLNKEAEKSEKITAKPAKSKPVPVRLSEEEATLALWRWPKRLRLLGSVLLVLSLVALGFALWRGLSTSSILFVAMVAILFSLGGDLLGWWLAKNTNPPQSKTAESSK